MKVATKELINQLDWLFATEIACLQLELRQTPVMAVQTGSCPSAKVRPGAQELTQKAKKHNKKTETHRDMLR